MTACKSCHAPVVWVTTEGRDDKPGQRMPLDADPDNPTRVLYVPDGNLMLTGRIAADGSPMVRYAEDGNCRTHFQTCPFAAQHRKPRR